MVELALGSALFWTAVYSQVDNSYTVVEKTEISMFVHILSNWAYFHLYFGESFIGSFPRIPPNAVFVFSC